MYLNNILNNYSTFTSFLKIIWMIYSIFKLFEFLLNNFFDVFISKNYQLIK